MVNILAIVIFSVVFLALGVFVGLFWPRKGAGKNLEEKLESLSRLWREDAAATRKEQAENAKLGREELRKSVADLGEFLGAKLQDASSGQLQANNILGQTLKSALDENAQKIEKLTAAQQTSMELLRSTVSQGLTKIQEDNEKKLESIRQTVDEKLHATLERRLGESFKIVSERLENVQKGLGEMQGLAAGVGDLKKVLTNVKTRGIWGEVLLGNLLEQILSPEQYAANVATTGSKEHVEFAIKLPGRESETTWIPIDSKFPKEDYERLLAAQEMGDATLAAEAGKALETSVKKFAQDIAEKYISPPLTTDFGIMFVPSEGLYAEIIRRTETMELLQRKYHILVTGPTTLAALLNSLQMGFRTLAIQKRSSEVWETLGAVKTEFENYAKLMDAVKKKLDEASNTIDRASVRTRVINRKLRDVEKLSDERANTLLPLLSADTVDKNELIEEASE